MKSILSSGESNEALWAPETDINTRVDIERRPDSLNAHSWSWTTSSQCPSVATCQNPKIDLGARSRSLDWSSESVVFRNGFNLYSGLTIRTQDGHSPHLRRKDRSDSSNCFHGMKHARLILYHNLVGPESIGGFFCWRKCFQFESSGPDSGRHSDFRLANGFPSSTNTMPAACRPQGELQTKLDAQGSEVLSH